MCSPQASAIEKLSSHTKGNVVDSIEKRTAELLAPMIKRRLFVAIAHVNAEPAKIEPHVAEHLRWMDEQEARGNLWASGPFVQPGVTVGDGLTIFNTKDIEEARKLMEQEPLTKRALRTYEMHVWELREGTIRVNLHASSSR